MAAGSDPPSVSPELEAYRDRCQVATRDCGVYSLTLFLALLGVSAVQGLAAFSGIELLIFVISRGIRECGPWSMRVTVVLVLIEAALLFFFCVSYGALLSWGVTAADGGSLVSVDAVVIVVIVGIYLLWSLACAGRVLTLIRDHPVKPIGRAYSLLLAIGLALVVGLTPVMVKQLRYLVFTNVRDVAPVVITVDGERYHEQRYVRGPAEHETLAAVVLVPTTATVPAEATLPEGLVLKQVLDDRIELNNGASLNNGTISAYDPSSGKVEVLAEGRDMDWLEQVDRYREFTLPRLPESEQPAVRERPDAEP